MIFNNNQKQTNMAELQNPAVDLKEWKKQKLDAIRSYHSSLITDLGISPLDFKTSAKRKRSSPLEMERCKLILSRKTERLNTKFAPVHIRGIFRRALSHVKSCMYRHSLP